MPEKPQVPGTWPVPSNVRIDGRVCLVTGANSGCGKHTARFLNLRGGKVYMFCRSVQRGQEAIEELVDKYHCDASRLIIIQGDLCEFASVRKAAAEFSNLEDHLDILINNAGAMTIPKWTLTVDGYEIMWQSNHLGHLLLTELLLPLIKKSTYPGRIVMLSSEMQLYGDSVENKVVTDEKKFGTYRTYSRTKLANAMTARTIAEKLKGTDVIANSCHPGAVQTNLQRDSFLSSGPLSKIRNWFFIPEEDGGNQALYLALSPEVKNVTGQYFM
ncbi:hypothetical protein FO519_004253 [Halicephalobus sp. NKZ332]|nr:hypothetical protein FO519_004253 [Halicephalobus sp. NKZ332]